MANTMKIRRKKLDIIFSNLVRERSNYVCLNCNESFRDGLLDCCHIMGRRGVSLRWHPENAIAMCRKDHIWFTGQPFDFRDFCIDKFGEDLIAELRLVSNQPVKWSKAVREDIYKHYKAEYKAMMDKRIGFHGVIPFAQHEIMHDFGD